jgi:DNA invertase Pin-like site-specific DNA recombinase
MNEIRRVALYARTSTTDKQDPQMQLREMKEYAAHRNWIVSEIYQDHGYSGTNTKRPMLKKLLVDASTRKCDIVLVWKLDRFGRSLREILTMLEHFTEYGVEFCSQKDNLDFSTSQGRLMAQIIGAFAQFEADLIRMRVLSGLENARAKGKILGRPRIRDDKRIKTLKAQGLSQRAIAKKLKISKGTVQNALSERFFKNDVKPLGARN